jgi:hypothetical protein
LQALTLDSTWELPMKEPMHPSSAYLRLAEGPEDLLGQELSFTRRLLTFFVALVLFSGTTLFATAALDLDHGLIGKALAVTGKASDDNSGPGGDGDDDEADDNDDATDVNNLATGGGASHSDDNNDGDSDSSTHQNDVRVKADDSNSDQNGDGQTDSSHGQQVTDSNSDENNNGGTDSSQHHPNAQFTDSGTDDNNNGATDSHEAGELRHR